MDACMNMGAAQHQEMERMLDIFLKEWTSV